MFKVQFGSQLEDFADAVARVPRAEFLQYSDEIGPAPYDIPSASAVPKILQAMELQSGLRVLHAGAGCGYLAAVMAAHGAFVDTIEADPKRVAIAKKCIAKLKLSHVKVHTGECPACLTEPAHFDLILISKPPVEHADPFFSVTHGARVIGLEGEEIHQRELVEYTFSAPDKATRKVINCVDCSRDTGEILVDAGLLSRQKLDNARAEAESRELPLIDIVRRMVTGDPEKLYTLIASQRGIPLCDIDELMTSADHSLFHRFPSKFLEHYRLIPLRIDDDILSVATSDPDASREDISRAFPQYQIAFKLVTPNDFTRLWSSTEIMLQGQKLHLFDDEEPEKDKSNDLADGIDSSAQLHLVSLFETLVLDAISEKASDIHLEQYGDRVRVRLRIDGDLHDSVRYMLSPRELAGLVNVIKLRSSCDIAEHRLPQGGRTRVRSAGNNYDLRVQTQPTLYGEHVIIRLLPQNNRAISILELGFFPSMARRYERLLKNPSGLVLVVGPTGSGKSTTLYGGLQILAADTRRKVMTIEDPIEYSIDNVQQTQVKADIGFHFSDAMRAFVREDPDVILVGEIRDQETALEAIRASQTGHVVLSTLHCNDSVDAFQRLYDLGIHPNSIASELLAVIAQRLAKRVCTHCREPAKPDPEIAAEVFPNGVPKHFQCFEGKGCSECGRRGTAGRVAVIEMLEIDEEMRNTISKAPSIGKLRNTALEGGLVTMRTNALQHVVEGNIPFAELRRILPASRMGEGGGLDSFRGASERRDKS